MQGIFDEISQAGNLEQSIKFLSTFWFSLPTETLVFAKKVISEMPIVDIDWTSESFVESKSEPDESSLVYLLSSFRYYGNDEFKMSFGLLLKYLEKDKNSLGFIIRNLTNLYNFNPNDRRYAYYVQTHVVDTLIELMDSGRNYLFARLFILITEAFLQVEHRNHE
ncbi:MAG: hypothetical protein WC733_02420 [Methylophilus sp.]